MDHYGFIIICDARWYRIGDPLP